MVGQDEDGRVAPVNPDATLIDFPKLGAAADAFVRPEPRQMSLFAADSQALASLRPTALEHQPPVFRAHPHEEPVRPLAVPGVRLERALAFHDMPLEVGRIVNVSERLQRVSIERPLC